MDLKNIHSTLCKLFSNGYDVNNIKITCDTPTRIEITKDQNNIYFTFGGDLPKAEINKFLTFKLYLEGISFGENGGVIQIKNFPDIPFNYDAGTLFGSIKEPVFKNADEEINARFKSESKRKIASKCLHYAEAWATIASLNGVRFDTSDRFDRFVLRNKCYYFVEEQIKKDKELQYGTFVSIFILGLILPAIIKWAVERVIRSLLT